MLLHATAAEEQGWIRAALAEPVTRPQWRIWRYRAPAIVLGLSQRKVHESVCARAGAALPVLVRASGGGAVLAGPWLLGVTVLLPARHRLAAGALVDSYRWFGELHARLLHAFGVEAHLLSPPALREGDGRVAGVAPLPWACFGALSAWELVDDEGRKLCGLAQQRRANGIALVGGTLLWPPPWSVLCDALDRAADLAALTRRTTDCETLRVCGAVPAARALHGAGSAQREAFAAALGAGLDSALAQTFGDEAVHERRS